VSDKHPFPVINPDKNQIIYMCGRKGSGKSVNARETFRDWPYIDKLVIDPTGDADPGDDLGTITVTKLPTELPKAKAGEYVTLRWIANPASPTYADDLDRALGLALFPKNRRVLVWIDEAGEVFPANRTGPNGRTALKQSRHYYTSIIMCDPRPMNVDPLALAQADRVVMYDVPGPADRRRLAEVCGIEPRILSAELDAVREAGKFWFLLYVAEEHALYRCPPLPMSKGYKHAQQ